MTDLYTQLIDEKIPKDIARCAEEVLQTMNDKGQPLSLVEIKTNILIKKDSYLGSIQESLVTLALLDAVNFLEAKKYVELNELGLCALTNTGIVVTDEREL